jgi:PST family polysaccharide transporter
MGEMREKENLSRRTLIGLIWAGGEAVARALLQFGVLIVLARLLTPADYGVVGAGLVIVGISYVFAQLGVGPAVVQRKNLESRHLHTAFCFSLLFSCLVAGTIFLAAPLFAGFFRMPRLEQTLHLLSLVFPIVGLGVVSEALLQREMQFKKLARIEVTSYFSGFVLVAIPLAICQFGLWSLVVGQLTQMAVRTAQMLWAARWRPALRFDSGAMRELWQFSGGQSLAQLANYVASSGDAMVVGRFLGADAVGLYTRAYQLMLAPAILIGSVLEKVLFPALSKVQHQPELLARAYRQGNLILATFILPIAAAIIVLAPDAIPFALGQNWSGVALPLQLFSLGLLWRTGMKMSNSIIRAKGWANSFAICQTTYAITTVTFAWIGSRWGLAGVCFGVLASILGCYSFAAALSLRITRVRISEFLADHVPGLLLALCVAVIGLSLQQYLHTTALPVWAVLALTAGAIGLIAGAALLFFPGFFGGTQGEKARQKFLAMFNRRWNGICDKHPA